MFFVINIKKIRFVWLAALLFCVLTAIIILWCSANFPVSKATAAVQAGSHVLIIDAGHGGLDGGASSADGMLESDVNLAISLKAEAIANFLGINPVMTRSADTLDYPESADTISSKKLWDQKNRVSLINSTENPVLISIHQNTYPVSAPKGSQVLYGNSELSKHFGEITHNNLVENLCPDNRRVAAPISNDIYLMRSINCPAILVECGFLSNTDEACLLADNGYRTKIAMILIASYTQFTNEPLASIGQNPV